MDSTQENGGTRGQRSAINPEFSVWVSANAGTGKTHLLIDRITRLLLANVSPSRILCITFTRAAAAEMSTRLEGRLSRWGCIPEEKLINQLTKLLNRSPNPQEIGKARGLITEILDTPQGVHIRTIHSFCESLLARFPLESNLSPHFTVLDEQTSQDLLLESREQLLLESLSRKDLGLTTAFEHLMGLVNEQKFNNLLSELNNQRAKLSNLFAKHGSIANIVLVGRKLLGLAEDATREAILCSASSDDAFDFSLLWSAAEELKRGSSSDIRRGEIILKWLTFDVQGRANSFEGEYSSAFLTKKNQILSDTKLVTRKIRMARLDIPHVLKTEAKRVFNVQEQLRAIRIIEATQSVLTIGQVLLENYDKLKEQGAFLDYNDLIDRARHLLFRKGGVSWVHFKLDEGLDHILVDEAQDTSSTQWDVIFSLASDFFSGEGQRSKGQPTILGVGDEKQSIFSFQGAEPELFRAKGQAFENLARSSGLNWQSAQLQNSWRSVSAILEVVDSVFQGQDPRSSLLFGASESMQHKTMRIGQAGLVELWPIEKPENIPDINPWDTPFSQLEFETPDARLANKIAEKINKWLTSGERLLSANRPIEPGDILILVRTRGRFYEEMIRAMKSRDIPVSGRDKMILTEHLAVMDLMALGKFFLLPEDDLNLATVLKGPLINLTEDQLFLLASSREKSLWKELLARGDDDSAFNKARTYLTNMLEFGDKLPPFEFFSKILNQGGKEAIHSYLGADAEEPMDEFLSLALEFERKNVPSLQSFLHWMEKGAIEIKRDLEQEGKKVRIMTIHGAKGLQSEIVFLPDTCSVPTQHSIDQFCWFEGGCNTEDGVLWPPFVSDETIVTQKAKNSAKLKKFCEYQRLLYVAMTRARDRLYIAGYQGKKDPPKNCWYDLIENGINRLENVMKIHGNRGEVILRYEHHQINSPEERGSEKKSTFQSKNLPSWVFKSIDDLPKEMALTFGSRLDDKSPTQSPRRDGGEKRFKKGLLIHSLLQLLPETSLKNRRMIAETFSRKFSKNFKKGMLEKIIDDCLSIIEDKKFSELFGPESQAEVSIAGTINTKNGPMPFSGRVDRLLVEKKKVTIIEFKTDQLPSASIKYVPRQYLYQLACYRAVLSKIYKGCKIVCLLLWTEKLKAIEVPEKILVQFKP